MISDRRRFTGQAQGRAEGEAQGGAQGGAEGQAQGQAQGWAEGQAEGWAQGQAQGQAEDALVASVGTAARAGIDLVQVRERDLESGALVRLVARCIAASKHTHTRVLVNDRLDVAIAAGAHGVHLRGDSVPAPRVRALVRPGFLIGRSIHSKEEAARVCAEGGVDYLLFGTVFSTASKPGVDAAGVDALADVVSTVTLPVLAVGGITVGTIRGLGRTGAAGIAAIGVFADTPIGDLPRTIAELTRAFQETQPRS
jgi:thiamine-phosphate pyrophosphorylase